MHILIGQVVSGFGYAAGNLSPVMALIESRMGLANLVRGTLNIRIAQDYIVTPDATILPEEYGFAETLKLQRCLVSGRKAIIVRPDTHETRLNYGHGKNHLELMSPFHLRNSLGFEDGSSVSVEVEGDDLWWTQGL